MANVLVDFIELYDSDIQTQLQNVMMKNKCSIVKGLVNLAACISLELIADKRSSKEEDLNLLKALFHFMLEIHNEAPNAQQH